MCIRKRYLVLMRQPANRCYQNRIKRSDGMASQKASSSVNTPSTEIDIAELAGEVQHLELLARRSEAKVRRMEADTRLRELAKTRADASSNTAAAPGQGKDAASEQK